MKLHQTYKYKLRPTATQAEQFRQILGTCRFLYNAALEHRIEVYQATGKGVSCFDQINELPIIKKIAGFEWFSLPPSQTLQDALKRLDLSYQTFFKGGGFPKFKGKDQYTSFVIPLSSNVKDPRVSYNRFTLPKIGSVKYYSHRLMRGKPKRATLLKEGNAWYLCILCEIDFPPFIPATESQSVGLDWGVKHFFTLSNGHQEPNPRFFDKYKKKLELLQQSLARKTKGSHNWKNIKRRINRLHSKIARARRDWHHKLSANLVRTFPKIIVEKLNIKGMTKRPKKKLSDDGTTYLPNKSSAKGGLNRSILDTAPSQFFEFLAYKCLWQKRDFEMVNPKNTSRECSDCGHISKENRKTQELFLCVHCGHTANADVNASQIIKSRGSTTLVA